MTIHLKARPALFCARACAFLCAVLLATGFAVMAQDPAAPEPAADPIAAARANLDANPDDAKAHLQLAQALGHAMQQNPALGMQYAADMLSSLQKAIELDPKLTDAYQWLARYYMNAPPIAGGSLVEAEKVARRLIEIDAAQGNALLELVKQPK